eukprot:scaffold65067_cov67-Phaeocystis_antarctica.AAC.11
MSLRLGCVRVHLCPVLELEAYEDHDRPHEEHGREVGEPARVVRDHGERDHRREAERGEQRRQHGVEQHREQRAARGRQLELLDAAVVEEREERREAHRRDEAYHPEEGGHVHRLLVRHARTQQHDVDARGRGAHQREQVARARLVHLVAARLAPRRGRARVHGRAGLHGRRRRGDGGAR